MNKKFYLTTTIPYVNAAPHIGHALESVQADVLARYHRQKGEDVFFLTGTDENSLKNYQAAKEEGVTTRELVDRNAEVFKELGPALSLSFDHFIRTTEKRHLLGAQKLWHACQKDIYKKKYQGLYCLGCEMFFKESELENGLCPDHGKKPELIEEENYFFKLSRYQKQLEEIIESGRMEIAPQSRKNETLAFIKDGLEDFSISRSAKRGDGWGVGVPGDESQRMYVWYDALGNYLTALGYGSKNEEKYKKYWPADLHCLGKGVLRFHAVYWPAILLSAGLPLPKKLFVHGYLTINGQKISKSLGNVVDPFALVDQYGTDAVRYFLTREFASAGDGNFSLERLKERYHSDLANGLGNLAARTLNLSQKAGISLATSEKESIDNEIVKAISLTDRQYHQAMNEIRLHDALEAAWYLMALSNEYIEKNKPWELINKKTVDGRLKEILSSLLLVLSSLSFWLEPFIPESSCQLADRLNRNEKGENLFPRRD